MQAAQRLDLDRGSILGELTCTGGLASMRARGRERGAWIAAAQGGHRLIDELDLAREIDRAAR